MQNKYTNERDQAKDSERERERKKRERERKREHRLLEFLKEKYYTVLTNLKDLSSTLEGSLVCGDTNLYQFT